MPRKFKSTERFLEPDPKYGYPSLPDQYVWDVGPAPGTFAAYTTDPLPADETFLGSASLDLWLSSQASDTDVQVTLTEVRPEIERLLLTEEQNRLRKQYIDRLKKKTYVRYF